MNIRKEVEVFVEEMEKVLQSKDHLHPNGWSEDDVQELYERLNQKIWDMHEAFVYDDKWKATDDINNELVHALAIDVANFAMMIADKTRNK